MLSIVNVVPDRGYGGIQQVAAMIESFGRQRGFLAETFALSDCFEDRQLSWFSKWLRVAAIYRKSLLDRDPVILIIHNPIAALLLPQSLKKRVIYVIHGPQSLSVNGFVRNISSRVLHLLAISQSSMTVTVSSGLASEVPFWLSAKVRTIHNAPSDAFFGAADQSNFEYLKYYDGIKLIHFGRMCHQKNQEFSIKLLCRIVELGKKAQLVLIGSGDSYDDLLLFSRRSGLNVCSADETPSPDHDVVFSGPKSGLAWIKDYFDVAIFPSRYEGFPLSILECLAIGMPVISSDCRFGPREIYKKYSPAVSGWNLLTVLPEDVESEKYLHEWCAVVGDIASRSPKGSLKPISVHLMRHEMASEWHAVIDEAVNESF